MDINQLLEYVLKPQENLAHLSEGLGALYGLAPATFEVETCNVAADKDYARDYAECWR